MKRIIVLCLGVTMIMSMVACGKKEEVATTEVATTEKVTQEVIEEITTEITTEAEEEFEPVGEWSCHNSNGEKTVMRFDKDGTGDSITKDKTLIDFIKWEYDSENNVMNVTYVDYNTMYNFPVRKQEGYYIIYCDSDPNFFFVKDENYEAACTYDGEATDEDSEGTVLGGMKVKQGDVIEKDFAIITLEEVGAKENIKYTSTESGISVTNGPQPMEGKTFLYVKGTIKNMNKQALSIDGICGKIIVDGYEYEAELMVCETSASPVSDVQPLDTVVFELYCAIPNELVNEMESVTIGFAFNNNFEAIDSLGMESCDYQYVINYK